MSDFAHGLGHLSTYRLTSALEAGDIIKIDEAVRGMVSTLREVNQGHARIENATHVWARRLASDFF